MRKLFPSKGGVMEVHAMPTLGDRMKPKKGVIYPDEFPSEVYDHKPV